MVNLWRDKKGGDVFPKKITYRATSPLYAGEKYRIMMDEDVDNIALIRIIDSYGKVSMAGQIESA